MAFVRESSSCYTLCLSQLYFFQNSVRSTQTLSTSNPLREWKTLLMQLTTETRSRFRGQSMGKLLSAYVFDQRILIRLFTIANSDVSTGIVSFCGKNLAKFSLVHTFALPSTLIPIMLGLGLKNPNFLKRTLSPQATSLRIKNASALLIMPISLSRCILSVMTQSSGQELHIADLLMPYSYNSTMQYQVSRFSLHLQISSTSPSSQAMTASCFSMLLRVMSLYSMVLDSLSSIFLQLCYSKDDLF